MSILLTTLAQRQSVRLTAMTLFGMVALAACSGQSPQAAGTKSKPPAKDFVLPSGGLIGCDAVTGDQNPQMPEGLGGNVAAFAKDHEKTGTSSYGNAVGPDLFSVMCLPNRDVVASIDYNLERLPPSSDGSANLMAESEVLQAARDNYLMPFDAKETSATQVGTCKLLMLHSDTLAAAASGVDTSGNFTIELTRPTTDGSAGYDPSRVGDLLLTLDTSGGGC